MTLVSERVSDCGRFAAWTSAWLLGQDAYDHALASAGPNAQLFDHTAAGGLGSVGELLAAWRRGQAAGVRAVFPVPGDVRGLSGPDRFRTAALEAGAAVLAVGIAAVATRPPGRLSSARELITWHAYDAENPAADPLQLEDAAYDLTAAIRECASTLSAAAVGGSARDVREELSDARRAGERLSLPSRYPGRAVQLLAQAERMAAVLELALADPVGGAVDRVGMSTRTDALRPLVTAVRRARTAAYNALLD